MDEKKLLKRIKDLEERMENIEGMLTELFEQFEGDEEEYTSDESYVEEVAVPIFTDNIFKNINMMEYQHAKRKKETKDALKSEIKTKEAEIAG